MDMIFTRRYSMAHRLIAGTSLKCATPHGHNEYVKVRCRPLSSFCAGANMALDFGSAKGRWFQWIDNSVDHAFQLSDQDPLVTFFRVHEPEKLKSLLITPGDPTTEMLLLCMARKFWSLCGSQLELITIEIEETPTNTVTLDVSGASHTQSFEDQWLLKQRDSTHWWDRSDMSINDLLPLTAASSSSSSAT